MKIKALETLLANAGQRNYLFVRLVTDTGLVGIGEATLEWQEKAVDLLLNEWVASRVIGKDPFDIEDVVGGMIRDQYQGGSTVMTAISGAEIAMWDIIGKATGQPVYRLIGGKAKQRLDAYANGWYGGCVTPQQFAARAREVVARGYRALKFDPFTTAWKILDDEEADAAHAVVAAVAEAVGPTIGLMIEFHGRLGEGDALRFIRRLDAYNVVWCEEPVAPENLEMLADLRRRVTKPISSGERLYAMADFARLISLRAADVVQMDVAHCGGISAAKKIAAMAATQDMAISPHCSIGPVALAAALHVAWSTPNMLKLECFAEFDVDWRNDLVCGWNPLRNGSFMLPERPGLGLELDEAAIAAHPYKALAFPSLWDNSWRDEFTGTAKVSRV
ncbi:mandelate racemase/muconate lactonizing enzyme family protein [Nordella sp. HKS 07]|uniref:mandelate racemase/muconate lactonizing enzyme family protein n=1 Tax=Nordella sp. HKS 07 TaxID=2712222 RepID=UPI0013E15B84|nr:mandelate racemase/muconate lactonizing enzyme family protein [Nordella sp. HKS 07]QIG47752.1 mandelate racemase/muconate lactonizing enzyme family protein [Nordella sp. HKS 07]